MDARQVRAQALVAALRLTGRMPRGLYTAVGSPVARVLGAHPNKAVRQWQLNIRIATGAWPDEQMTRAGVASWWRNLGESVQLPHWSRQYLLDHVWTEPVGLSLLYEATAGPGAVLALPHLGSWDVAGAWASANGLPVTAVAEQLPKAVFEYFRDARASVGMRVLSERDPAVMAKLASDVTAGQMVCLVSDRDFTRHGVEVGWPTPDGSVPVHVPAGPARLAQLTGAKLFCVTTHYAPPGMKIEIQAVPTPPPDADPAPYLQLITDGFSAAVRAHPVDWHVMQPFFPRSVELGVVGES